MTEVRIPVIVAIVRVQSYFIACHIRWCFNQSFSWLLTPHSPYTNNNEKLLLNIIQRFPWVTILIALIGNATGTIKWNWFINTWMYVDMLSNFNFCKKKCLFGEQEKAFRMNGETMLPNKWIIVAPMAYR